MKSLKFSCPDDLRVAVKNEARKEDRSESSIIRNALRRYLEEKENGNANEIV